MASSIRYERPDPHVARVVLAKVEVRNAQDKRMIHELDEALYTAAHDNDVRVIVVAADGPHFSSGHDTRDTTPFAEFTAVGCWGGWEKPGAEGLMAAEEEFYLGMAWRWRNIPKPTIAQVHGKCIAGGLLVAWTCDLIVAAENASFSDPVVALGMNGHEFFVHAYEFGARMAKRLLFTGEALSAQDAYRIGMVSDVVPLDELEEATMALARRIALRPTMGLKLAKEAVNQSLEAQGQWNAVRAAFGLHHVGHSHNMQLYGQVVHPDGPAMIRQG